MKRICCYCQKDMGEKCMGVGCGSTNLLGPVNGVYACVPCKRMWVEGSEPVSHGICEPPCPQALKAGVRPALVKSEL